MAASAWSIFDVAKRNIGNNTISLSATSGYNISLHSNSASTNLSGAITVWSSIGSEITAAGGYAAGGLALSGTVWTVGTSAGQYKFDCTDPVFTASGAALTSIRYAVIFFSAGATSGYPLCYAPLSTAQFSVASGNTLTIQMAATGIFTLA